MTCNVSIDRLTIVAKDSLFLSSASYPNFDGLQRYGTSSDVFQIIAQIDEENIENIAYINFFDFGNGDKRGIRVDFNPNRMADNDIPVKYWHTLDMILASLVGVRKLSRIDIAFDDFSDRMANYRYYKPGVKKTIFERNGEMETIYYGSPLSDKQIRQYNKQRERLAKGERSNPWWRLELQLRTKFVDTAHSEIEEMLKWFKPMEWDHVENLQDRMALVAMDVRPEFYGELSRYSKAKINKYRLNSPVGELSKEFYNVFNDKKNDLKLQINKYLADYQIEF